MTTLLNRCEDIRKCVFCRTDGDFQGWDPCPDHLGEYVQVKKEMKRLKEETETKGN